MSSAELITYKHVKRVNELLGEFAIELIRRGNRHDDTKFLPAELGPLEEMQKLVDKEGQAPYGSEEYKRRLEILKPMLDHHYANNSHHPEWTFSKEKWKPVIDFEELYEVSNLGRIKSVSRTVERSGKTGNLSVNELIREGYVTPKGYIRIQLSKSGKPHNLLMHILVARAWLGEKPEENYQINHKNGIKSDNRAENLEWVTPSENLIHAYETELRESNAKYVFVCEDLDISTIGAEKMAKILREEFGYEKVSASGIYNSAINGGKHLDISFKAYKLFVPIEVSPINGMNLLDVVEMILDWKAASERGEESFINLTSSQKRFNIDPQVMDIIKNTYDSLNFKYV